MAKKNIFLWLIAAFVVTSAFAQDAPLSTVRTLFVKLDKGEQFADSLIAIASKHSSGEMMAYKGAATAAKASYMYNPYSKYKIANKGIAILNAGVSKAPKSLEARFVRYSVELNIPSFFPFTNHLKEDKAFLINNLNTKHAIYPDIKAFMLKFGDLTEAEKKKFI